MDPGKLDPAMKGNSGNGCLRDVDTHPELGVGCCLAEEKKIDFLGILPPRRQTLEKDERKNKEQKKKGKGIRDGSYFIAERDVHFHGVPLVMIVIEGRNGTGARTGR